jgi:MFS family permease
LTWAARGISSIGDGLLLVALPLLATRLTHSAVLISGVAFASTVPWVLFALPAGAVADRVSRRRLLTSVELGRVLILTVLAISILTGRLGIVQLYLAAFLIASFETLFDSATMAVIPQIVGDDQLMHANSRLLIAQASGEQFVGPALGGLALAVAASAPVLLDASSYAVSALLLTLALLPPRRLGRHGAVRRDDGFVLNEPSSTEEHVSFVDQIREGLAWLLREPRVRLVCGLNASFAFCQWMGFGVLVIYCTRVLHLGAAGFGLFTAAAATGNIVGAWAAPRVDKRWRAGPVLVAAGVLCGLAFLVVASTSSVPVAAIALAVEAIGVGVGRVAILALRQRLTPLEVAGRASAAIRSTVVGSGAIAALLGGVIVTAWGPHAPFAIGGAIQVLAAVLIGGALVRRLATDNRQVVDLTEEVDLREEAVQAATQSLAGGGLGGGA